MSKSPIEVLSVLGVIHVEIIEVPKQHKFLIKINFKKFIEDVIPSNCTH
jgi:hypothetical protein